MAAQNVTASLLLIISKSEAKAAGLKRYFTCKPCRRMHVSERYVRSGMCCECTFLHNKANVGKLRIRPAPTEVDGLRGDAARAGLKHYFTGIPCRYGHVAKRYVVTRMCVECGLAFTNAWRKRNPEKLTAISRARYRADPQKVYEHNKAWRKANPLRSKQQIAKWRRNNSGAVNALNKKRAAAKLNRTPAWADLSKIKEIYEQCPSGHHVDHIIPLLGKTVSGLHVEANLQWLPGIENIRKGNRW